MTVISGMVPRTNWAEDAAPEPVSAVGPGLLDTPSFGRRFPFVLRRTSATPALPDPSLVLAQLERLSRDVKRLERELQVLSGEAERVQRQVDRPALTVVPGNEPDQTLYFRLLGRFEVTYGEQRVTDWPSRKGRLLLAYLAFYSRRPVSKDVLMDLFWPDSSSRRASNNLSIAVHQVRGALGSVVSGDERGIHVYQGLYGLDPSISVAVDVDEFRAAVAEGRLAAAKRAAADADEAFNRAIALYRGEFLESDLYEEWTIAPRREMGHLYLEAITWLARSAIEGSDWRSAIDYLSRLIEADPVNELGYRGLMRAHAELGSRGEARHIYETCVQQLSTELGVEPSPETQALYRRLLAR